MEQGQSPPTTLEGRETSPQEGRQTSPQEERQTSPQVGRETSPQVGRETSPQMEVLSGTTLAADEAMEEVVQRAATWPEDEGEDEVFYQDEDGGGGPPGPPCSLEETQPPQHADAALELQYPDLHTWGDQTITCNAAGCGATTLASQAEHPGPGEGEALVNQEEDMMSSWKSSAEESEELEDSDHTEVHQQNTISQDALQQNTSSQESLSSMSTQSLRRTSGQKNSFNHHTNSKYNTISYRKIRPGNTQKKISEFESMMMNI